MKRFDEHSFYLFSLAIKAFDGATQLLGSLALLFIDTGKIPMIANSLFRKELIEDPNDAIANFFIHSVEKMDLGFKFAAFAYLFSHGFIKILLVIALLKKKIWAYPLSEAILVFFIIYQTYSYFSYHSVFMLFFNAVDIVLIFLVWAEYRKARLEFSGVK